MKKTYKCVSLGLAGLLIISNINVAYGATSSSKEEVVYVKTNINGETKNVNVVNIFGSGHIVDYGDYSDVKMLTSTEEIYQTGNKITFTTNEDRVYYQGTLSENTNIPWNIDIHYFIDGIEYTSDEIAGMSGKLEITFKISENEDCETDFYDHYALQASLSLDTEKCSNIIAEDATIANAGSAKQLSYTILPGNGLDTTITADVVDFEMDSISINGIELSLSIDIDDEEITEQVDEIIDAVEELNDGANELDDGASELLSGTSELSDGTDSLTSGLTSLSEGITSLQTGINTMQDGLEELNSQSDTLTEGSAQVLTALETIEKELTSIDASIETLSQLTTASGQIQTGIEEIYEAMNTLDSSISYNAYKQTMNSYGLDIDTLIASNTSAAASVSELYTQLNALLENLKAQGYDIFSYDLSSLQQLSTLLTANNQALGGVETYLNTLDSGSGQILDALETLDTNYETFDESINELVTTLSSLMTNLTTLSTAITTLTDSYETLDTGINDYTEGVATILAGYSQLVSGVNTLSSGSKELIEGSNDLSEGTDELYSGVSELKSGTSTLSEGTNTFYTTLIDLDISETIDEMVDSFTGGDYEVESFVSNKNTNVESVQFVITTDSIEIEEEEEVDETVEEETGFLTKLINLFKNLF